MENAQTIQTNQAAQAINIISGAYASPLVDALHEICGDDSMQGVCHSISAFGEESRTIEAIQLICALMDITGIECPKEIELLEENEIGREIFVSEFVADLNDILYSA